MKKIILVVLAIILIGGCATFQDYFCSNRAIVEKTIATAQATITTVEAMFPDLVPVEYQAIINTATAVIAQGEAYLSAGCPTAAQVQTLEVSQAQMNLTMKVVGLKTAKALKGK